jgi:hypothetical protein
MSANRLFRVQEIRDLCNRLVGWKSAAHSTISTVRIPGNPFFSGVICVIFGLWGWQANGGIPFAFPPYTRFDLGEMKALWNR